MPIFRIDESAIKDNEINISDETLLHHLMNVRRIRENDSISFFTHNQKLLACVIEINKSKISCAVENASKLLFPKPEITLVQAIIDKEPTETLLRLNIPYYVKTFAFFKASRSNFTLTEKTLQRLRLISLSVAEQSEVCFVPTIKNYNTLKAAIDEVQDCTMVTLSPHSKIIIASFAQEFEEGKGIAIVVGPKGGFIEEELETLEQSGSKNCALASGIYKSELAGFVAVSFVRELHASGI